MTEETLTVEIIRGDDGVRIAEYTRTESALAELEKRFKGMVFDVSTGKGMKEAKDARKELRDLRVALEKKRKDLKAPVLDYTRALDGQAKTITARIEALESPVDQQIKDEEARKAREKAEAEAAERKRTDANRACVEKIRNRPLDMIGSKAAEIWDAYQEVQGFDLEALDEDFRTEGALVRDEAAGKLHELYSQAQESEAAAIRENVARVEREKAEKEAREKREAERAAEIAELEELRKFKAKQEVAARVREKEEAQERPDYNAAVAGSKAAQEDEKNRAAAASLEKVNEVPWTGMDMATGSDETVETKIDPAPRTELMAETDFQEARDSLTDAMEGALTMEQAEAILDEIIAGRITHVAYIGTPSLGDEA